MAMDNPAQTYGVISEVVEDAKKNQGKAKEKANTVTTGIGAAITAILAALAYLAENGTALPEWTPIAVTVLGLIATVFGVNKTKNGVTQSVADQLNHALTARIDQSHELGHVEEATPDAVTPIGRVSVALDNAGEVADRLDGVAKRLADRRKTSGQ